MLGLLPGGGSFYTENYGIGVVDLLFWPLSILWDPINGNNGAKAINYYATKERVRYLSAKEKKDLTLKLETGQVSQLEYAKKRREIEEKYSSDM